MDRDLGKFKVGQEVWIKVENMSNVSRKLNPKDKEEWIYKGEVIKTGRKYVTVKFKNNKMNYYNEEKFNKDDDYRNFYTCGGADYKLYLTKQDILEEYEASNIYDEIREYFSYFKNPQQLTLNQLKEIRNIILYGEDK